MSPNKIPKQPIPLALSPWPYFLSFTVFFVFYLSTELQCSYAAILYAFFFIPFVDLFCGIDEVNPTKAMERQLREDTRYRWIVILWVPFQICSLIYSLHVVCVQERFSLFSSMSDFVLFGMSVGTIGGLGINVAHELVHKVGWLEPTLGKLLLATVCYEHFAIEHIRGHHKRVSTPEDAASAPMNMTSWRFVVRSLVGSLTSAWDLDAIGVSMGFVHTACIFALILGTLIPVSKWGEGICFLLIQSAMAIFMLEMINYIEHYGLQRSRLPDGEYEAVTQFHSWNAAHRLTNYFLFKLQRHSDHHALGGKRYQTLRTYSASPHLPYGYGGMILLSIFRPYYFMEMMNPKAEEALRYMRECRAKGIDPFALERND